MAEHNYPYQHVGFHFAVNFTGLGQDEKGIDARFQSVTGLEVQLETETIKEGGENRFEHVLPVRTKYSALTLKRGMLTVKAGSEITKWCKSAFDAFGYNTFDLKAANNAKSDKSALIKAKSLPVIPIDLEVYLLNENHKPLAKWKIIHAWPKSWKFGELNAEKGEVLLETLELHYNRFEFVDP